MGLFDLFKGKDVINLDRLHDAVRIGATSLDPSSGEVETKEYTLDEWSAELHRIMKDAVEAAPPPNERPYDVFLCHNSDDKETVLAIGQKLKAKGIKPWIDSERIGGGELYQKALTKAVEESRSAAIFVGCSGLGLHQEVEVDAFTRLSTENGFPVFPILLPQCGSLPERNIYLERHHFIKFSHIDDQDALDALIKAIREAMNKSN